MSETDDESMDDWEIATTNDLNDLKQCLTLEFLEAQPHQPSGTVTDTVDMKDFRKGATITFDSEGFVNNKDATITVKECQQGLHSYHSIWCRRCRLG